MLFKVNEAASSTMICQSQTSISNFDFDCATQGPLTCQCHQKQFLLQIKE